GAAQGITNDSSDSTTFAIGSKSRSEKFLSLQNRDSGMAHPSLGDRRMIAERNRRSEPMDIVVLGIDLGKNVCSVVGLGAAGQVLVRRRMKRESVVTFAQRWPSF